MSKPEKKAALDAAKMPDSKRRNFLIGAGLGGVGAAAALAAGTAGIKPEPQSQPEAEADAKGYRETEHVRRYYGTTRI